MFHAGDKPGWPRAMAFVDADWAGDVSRRSTTGFVLCYNGAPIMWSAKLQAAGKKAVTNLPAMSSGEAEYNALAFATREVVSFRNLMYHCDDHAVGMPAAASE